MEKIVNPVRKSISVAKNHVVRHRGAYIMGAVAFLAIALQQHNRVEFNKFLESRDIDPMEYYNPEYFAELNS